MMRSTWIIPIPAGTIRSPRTIRSSIRPGAAGDLGIRLPQSLAVQVRSEDRPALGRRRRPGHLGDDRVVAQGRQSRLERDGRDASVSSGPQARADAHRAADRRASPHRVPLDHRRLRLSGLEVPRAARRLSIRRLPVRQDLGTSLRPQSEEGHLAQGTRGQHGKDLELRRRPRRLVLRARLRRRARSHNSRSRRPPPRLPPFPRKLSETGLFTSVRDHKVAPGVMPYSINAPFWSDGAQKERSSPCPATAAIEFKERSPGNGTTAR